ncbi:MAG: hypothetical protein Q4P78_02345 [Rothia sp. (in: high G+C Gram-positive bacteria)]|uniref:hypothetical protein n=1 Tax=Rothia sp. (in: high G+C Gram-positive bacteria) TaxID=1885016 RepID=UPI0026E111D4|nr:hypothetical protein [Rothia sp. (in: high G+C Gram-positive bacteria)]MDO5750027.1 hypothetical protein [Rothia sp. (in: high G+C Gram-positive bacteria)]
MIAIISAGLCAIIFLLPSWLIYKSTSMTINTFDFSYPNNLPENTYKYSEIQGFWVMDTSETPGLRLSVKNKYGASTFNFNTNLYHMRYLLAQLAFACEYRHWCEESELALLETYVNMENLYKFLAQNYNHINFDFIDDEGSDAPGAAK